MIQTARTVINMFTSDGVKSPDGSGNAENLIYELI